MYVNDIYAYIGKCSNIEKALEAASTYKGFILLLKYDESIVKRIKPAYINALVLSNDHLLHAKNLALEMLCLIANTFNIKDAIDLLKPNKELIIISNGINNIKDFAELNNIELEKSIELDLDLDIAFEMAYKEVEKGL